MTFVHSAFGLRWRTPFSCPPLSPAPAGDIVDVVVSYGTVPRELPSSRARLETWQAACGAFLLDGGERAGRFLVEGGARVTVERAPAADEDVICSLLMGAVFSMVLAQRGMLVLHANAAACPGGAVVLSGEPGAGKSSTLDALVRQGWSMLSDDVTALRLGDDGRVYVLPGVPQLRLCDDTVSRLGLDSTGWRRHPLRPAKAAMPTHPVMARDPAPLLALHLLEKHPGDEVRVRPLTGWSKFAALQTCLYGPSLLEDAPGLFTLASAVVRQAGVFRIERPEARWTVPEIVDVISSAVSPPLARASGR